MKNPLESLFGASWRTTTFGGLTAILLCINQNPALVSAVVSAAYASKIAGWSALISALLTAWHMKDKGVTGGTVDNGQVTTRITPLIAAFLIPALFLNACTWAVAHQSQITSAEQTLASALQIAAPLIPNKTLSNDAYGIAAVATAYGNAPVPTTIAQASALVPQDAAVLLPMINGNNSPKTQAIINGAAALLANETVVSILKLHSGKTIVRWFNHKTGFNGITVVWIQTAR